MSISDATKVISFVNLKGGVGKTTSAINVAAMIAKCLSFGEQKSPSPSRVLLIDLDPQSNATLGLIGSEENEISAENTIFDLFSHELSATDMDKDHETFDLEKIIVSNPINELNNLDLIPASLNLFDIPSKLVTFQNHYLSATDILYNALEKRMGTNNELAYTHIIIDCPPSMGLVSLNGLSMSNYYIVPTFLDSYSHWGLDKIFDEMQYLSKRKATCKAKLLGIFYSRVNQATQQNKKWKEKFTEKIYESNQKRIHKGKGIRRINILKSEIPDYDVVRKAQTERCPIVLYKHSGDKRSLSIMIKRYYNLTLEIVKIIYGNRAKYNFLELYEVRPDLFKK